MSHSATAHALQPNAELQSLEDQITELTAHIDAATFRLLELIREFDERNGWEGCLSCAHWLSWRCGIALGAAREKVRVARALPALPQISAAFREGRISYSKVRAMTRVATPANEDYLMMIAECGTASHVERLVRGYRYVKRCEALEDENRRHELRELSWHMDGDGCWVFRGALPPEAGARVIQALEAAMEADFREQEDVPAETPLEPVAARRADALTRMAEGYLAGDEASTGGDRTTLHLHADLETLRAEGTGAAGELEGSGHVSAETSRRLACDAGVIKWLEDTDGEPLNVGRRTRSIPPAIRRALQRRDQGCRFPGCTATRFVDAHHVQHWADGGETSLNNLVLLCRHHHRLVHEGGYGVSVSGAGVGAPAPTPFAFIRPDGNVIPPVPAPRFRGNVVTLFNQNRRAGVDITPTTALPHWHGERMDAGMAVEGLLARE